MWKVIRFCLHLAVLIIAAIAIFDYYWNTQNEWQHAVYTSVYHRCYKNAITDYHKGHNIDLEVSSKFCDKFAKCVANFYETEDDLFSTNENEIQTYMKICVQKHEKLGISIYK